VKPAYINWKKCDQIASVFGGIQLVMTNGKESPLFLTKVQNANNLIKEEFDASKVRKIRGTSNNYWISQI